MNISHGIGLAFARNLPVWAPQGASVALDFTAKRYLGTTPEVLRNSPATMVDSENNVHAFEIDRMVRLNTLGAQVCPPSENLFLHSNAPQSQIITLVEGQTYTVSVLGEGGVEISGAGEGQVREAEPLTFIAGTNAVSVTISGAPRFVQVEPQSFATAPIETAVAIAGRAGDRLTAEIADGGRAFVFEFDLREPVARGDVIRFLLNWHSSTDEQERYSAIINGLGDVYLDVGYAGAYRGGVFAGQASVGRNIFYGVAAPAYIRPALIGGVPPAAATGLSAPTGLNTLGLLGTGTHAASNSFGLVRRYCEAPISNFDTPEAGFVWAETIGQAWTSLG